MNNNQDVKVSGVYEDLPYNTEFRDLSFIAPWDLYVSTQGWVQEALKKKDWNNSSWQVLAQLNPNVDIKSASRQMIHMRLEHTPEAAFFKPETFLLPMSDWHLYSAWDKAGNQDGRIQYVWLFGIIGIFVLLLASINFMNLSTARSEKRAREVGVRKAIGSMRRQLIGQFLSESLTVVAIAFVLAILLVVFLLPVFNEIADKKMFFPWENAFFWAAGIAFCLITGIVSGSYPALYLSSFQPVRVLKGSFRVGSFAAVPRKVLVVLQFTVSVTLIIGTIIVYKQIQHAKNRPIGYDRSSLITVAMNTPELYKSYNTLRASLLETGVVVEMSESSTPATEMLSSNDGFQWPGKDPNMKENFGTIAVTHDFGKTVGWQFVEGRDLSQRTKEIGVRKVLGASVTNLWVLLSRDFLVLVIVASVLAIPIAYYFLNDWLQIYEYRTDISWWIFAAAGFGALAITLLTVSYQAIKATLMNPVKSLRGE